MKYRPEQLSQMARVALAVRAADALDWRWHLLCDKLMLRTGLSLSQVIENMKGLMR